MDQKLRDLQRRAQQGDLEARAAYVQENLRRGLLSLDEVKKVDSEYV